MSFVWLVLAALITGAPTRTVIRVPRLLDPVSGELLRNMIVTVEGSRITGVQPAAQYRPQAGDQVMDLGDVTLVPGLIDAHVHLSIGGPPRANAVADLHAGFTTVADLGAVNQRIQVVRDSIAAGVWEG